MSGPRDSWLPAVSLSFSVITLYLLAGARATASPSLTETRPQIPASVEFRQRVFTREQGLPDNRVLSLLQSRDGFLWIGTASGLARFDGSRFEVFGPDSFPEFVNDECTALAEGLDGAIWIGTEDGLLRLHAGHLRRFTEQDGLVNQRIHSLCAARNGDVWIGTARGLNRLRRGIIELLPMPYDAKDETRQVRALCEDVSGAVWCTSSASTRKWDPQSDQLADFSFPAGRKQYAVALANDSRGNVWLKADFLFAWSPGGTKTILQCDGADALLVGREGSVWFNRKVEKTQQRGLYRFQGGKLVYYEIDDGLSDNWVTALLEDQRGNLWIGTYSGGLNCWQPRRFPTLGKSEGLVNETVRTLAPGREGKLWIGTDEGVSQWRGRRINPSAIWAQLVDERIRALHEAADGTLWICTGDDVESWDGIQLTQHRWLFRPGGDKYRTVTSDHNGVVWVGGESGLLRWQNQEWRQFTTTNGLPHNDVYALAEDSAGRLWLGTYGGGLSWWDNNSNRLTLTTTQGLSHNEVRALHADAEGFLWVGTEHGLNRVDIRGVAATRPSPSSQASERRSPIRRDSSMASQPAGSETGAPLPLPPIHAFTRRDGLYDDLVSEILEDDLGNLWISCSRGIYRVSKRELDEVASGRRARLDCIVYDEADGLLSTDISGIKSRPAGCKTPDGRLWFPNAKGLVVLDPRRVIQEDVPPPVVIEHFLVDGEDCAGKDFAPRAPAAAPELRGSGREPDPTSRTTSQSRFPSAVAGAESAPLRLAPGRARALEIQFTAPTFRAPERVRFRYRLEGLETAWQDAGTRRVALYTNLRPGAYRFQVQAASNIGLWNEAGNTLAFTLLPRLHERAWFWPAVVVLTAVLALCVVQWRLHLVRRVDELAKQAALAGERDRIARDMHDDLGAGLTRLVLLGERSASHTVDAEIRTAFQRLTGEAGALVGQLNDLIWCSNPEYDTLDNLLAHLREHAATVLEDAVLKTHFEPPGQIQCFPVSGYFRRQVLLMCKELLTNVVRHARASEVRLAARLESAGAPDSGTLVLEINDNGCGFDTAPDVPKRGHGLTNLRARAAALQGTLEVHSVVGQGTRIRLLLPLGPHLKGNEKAGK